MSTVNKLLGWNDWDEIRDPSGMIDIEPYTFDRIEKYKEPQDVQDMFDEYGVEEAVLRINREYLIRHGRYAIEIVDVGNARILRKAKP